MIASGVVNNLHVMLRLSLPILICQCVIFSVSFEGIVCPVILDFAIENFGIAEIYSHVWFDGNNRRGQFIFRKSASDTADSGRQRIVRIRDILRDTLKQEENCPKIASFSVNGKPGNYNIKFVSAKQTHVFVKYKTLPSHFKISWARIYLNWRPALIAYDYLDDGDLGFKVLDNGDYPDIEDRFDRMPNLFKRSDIRNEIRTSFPQTLYLRNRTYSEDYSITFLSTHNLGTFLKFFPSRFYNDTKTQGYYFVPFARNTDTSESHGASEMLNPSESNDTSETLNPSESHDLSTSHDTSETLNTSESQDTSSSTSDDALVGNA